MPDIKRPIPTVFVSSTREDLEPYRQAARNAATSAKFHPEMMEDFPASGHPPLNTCLERVDEADVLVAIVAYRYGWVPNEIDPKSITWLECLKAKERGKEVLAFLVDKECEWPVQLKESYLVMEALETGTSTPQLQEEVQRNIAKLAEFKQWLNGLGIRATFVNPDDLRGRVGHALREWRDRHKEFAAAPAHKGHDNPSAYLEYLREQTAWIDIRGLQVGAGKAYRFPIEDLYIPLTIPGAAPEKDRVAARTAVALEDALTHRRLVIVGDPGAGKTTFLRHIAYLWTSAVLDAKSGALLFPIFIRISELVEHILHCREQAQRPSAPDSPAWLIDFLNTRNEELNWGLCPDFFREKLASGSSILLLDGLDEAPGKMERDSVARLFENATGAWRECRFVVTTRPLAFAGLAGFETVQIEPLEPLTIEKFLEHWCHGLFPESDQSANRHFSELREALRARVEIRRMARNPVMLTALAVVHWNERRLPEQRADLYESILMWLARAREKRPGRELPERCLTLLQQLALAMQNHPNGRQVQVEKGWAADVLAPQFSDRTAALAFLEQEEVDSGIIVSRGAEVRFWHLTFQEYLAARAIAGLADAAQHRLLLDHDKIHKPEWREVALLLAGVLVRQGQAKVDGLFAAVLERLGPKLVQQARCAGLLGAMVRDLRPLNYRPSDSRYGAVFEAVLGIFDAKKAATIDFEVRLDAAEALGQAGDPRLNEDNWVTIEAGEFWMGAQRADASQPNYDPKAQEDEGPVCLVNLGAYQIGRYPVTVAEYQRFIDSDGYGAAQWWPAGGFGKKTVPEAWDEQVSHPNRPVVGVTWYEASAYCEWARVRLPTEAEWERAARGTDGRKYPWGNDEPDSGRANFDEKPGHVTPVGLYPAGATPDGIQDLAGNIDEWVQARYRETEARCVRGASFGNGAYLLRAALRSRFGPDVRYVVLGFRCVRELIP